MPTHLYCLVDARSDCAPPSEFPDVRALVVGNIAAWVATTSHEKIDRDARRAVREVLEHDRVIGRAVARGLSVVPATLADAYDSDDDVAADISARTDEIVDSLGRANGAVEMTIIIAADTPAKRKAAPSPSPGKAYLEALRDLPMRLNTLANDLDARLGSLSLAQVRRVDRDRVALSHLVRAVDVDSYCAAVRNENGDFRIVIDGPRAPYSFAVFSPRAAGQSSGLTRHESGRLDRA
jgi:hypothetical protein